MTLVDSFGTGVFLTGSVLFYVDYVGLSATTVGRGLTVAALVALLVTVPVGRLADRRGSAVTLGSLCALQLVGYLCFPFVSSTLGFALAVGAVIIGERVATPVRRAWLATLVPPEERVVVAAYNRSVFNAGFSLGTVACGVALAVRTPTAYLTLPLVNAVSYAIVIVLVVRIAKTAANAARPQPGGDASAIDRPAAKRAELPATGRRTWLRWSFLLTALLCGVLYSSASLLTVALPLWVAERTAAPQWIVAALLFLNTVLAIGLQVIWARRSTDLRSSGRENVLAGVLLAVSCAFFLASGLGPVVVAVLMLILATVALTFGELAVSAASWGLSFGLAPEQGSSEHIAAFDTASQLAQALSPLAVALVVAHGSSGWLVLGVVLAAAGFATPVTVAAAAAGSPPARGEPVG